MIFNQPDKKWTNKANLRYWHGRKIHKAKYKSKMFHWEQKHERSRPHKTKPLSDNKTYNRDICLTRSLYSINYTELPAVSEILPTGELKISIVEPSPNSIF